MFTHGENPSESLRLTVKITYIQLQGHRASQEQLSRFTEHRGSKAWVSGYRDRLKLKFQNQSKINSCEIGSWIRSGIDLKLVYK